MQKWHCLCLAWWSNARRCILSNFSACSCNHARGFQATENLELHSFFYLHFHLKCRALLLGAAVHVHSDVFDVLAWLVYRKVRKLGQATTDTGSLGSRCTQCVWNAVQIQGKCMNTSSRNSLLFSKIVQKLKIQVFRQTRKNSCESRTLTACTNCQKGWWHRYLFSVLEERYICVGAF